MSSKGILLKAFLACRSLSCMYQLTLYLQNVASHYVHITQNANSTWSLAQCLIIPLGITDYLKQTWQMFNGMQVERWIESWIKTLSRLNRTNIVSILPNALPDSLQRHHSILRNPSMTSVQATVFGLRLYANKSFNISMAIFCFTRQRGENHKSTWKYIEIVFKCHHLYTSIPVLCRQQ